MNYFLKHVEFFNCIMNVTFQLTDICYVKLTLSS